MLRKLASWNNPESMASRMRQKRFQLFESLFAKYLLPESRILDVGGTFEFWRRAGRIGASQPKITLLNIKKTEEDVENIRFVSGDATALPYSDQEFDLVFSNSVIEHLFTSERQEAMANEVRRVGKAYWVQTPNFWFPIEPHFHLPGWQWYPKELRYFMIQRFRCGWRGPIPDRTGAVSLVDEVRLLSLRNMRSLFPDGLIWRERVCGITKSLVAYNRNS